MGFGNVGKKWTLTEFTAYLDALTAIRSWKGVTIHHTAAPSLAQRPNGFTIQHIKNIQSFYEKERGWSTGPHLFTDDNEIFGMCPLNEAGIHAASFNATHIGIEMLGDYDSENPKAGRGKKVIDTSVATTALLLQKLGLEANNSTLKFHRDDPKTTKTCPGTRIEKPWFLGLVQAAMTTAPVVDTAPVTKPVLEIGPTIVLPDGKTFGTKPGETEEHAGRVVVAAYPFGALFGLDMAGMRSLLEATEGEYYDKENGWTMAILRELTPLLPGGPYKLAYKAATKTVTLSIP